MVFFCSAERLSGAPSGERLHLPLDEHLLDAAAEHAPLARHALRDPRARGRASRRMAGRGKGFFPSNRTPVLFIALTQDVDFNFCTIFDFQFL